MKTIFCNCYSNKNEIFLQYNNVNFKGKMCLNVTQNSVKSLIFFMQYILMIHEVKYDQVLH